MGKQSHLDWNIHEVERAHNKRCETGFAGAPTVSWMNLAKAFWDSFLYYFGTLLFSLFTFHAQIKIKCQCSCLRMRILQNNRSLSDSIRNQVTVIFLSNYLTRFCFPCLHINTIILFTQSDPYHGFTESCCAVWKVEMEIPCNTWKISHPSALGQKFKKQDVHFQDFQSPKKHILGEKLWGVRSKCILNFLLFIRFIKQMYLKCTLFLLLLLNLEFFLLPHLRGKFHTFCEKKKE